jgi:diguanylate cyclase (GGDEF)-like protein
LRKKAESQAQTDELTGLMNRRAFFRAAKYIFSLRERLPLTIIVIYADLDKFKKINDTMGHDMGDRVLCKFAELLKTGFRGTDIISRYGGDEFVLLLIDIDIKKAGILMGRIDKRFTDWGKEGGINVGISWGMKTPKKDCNDIDEILQQADEALYEEKIKKSA